MGSFIVLFTLDLDEEWWSVHHLPSPCRAVLARSLFRPQRSYLFGENEAICLTKTIFGWREAKVQDLKRLMDERSCPLSLMFPSET